MWASMTRLLLGMLLAHALFILLVLGLANSYQGGVTSTLGVNGPEVTYARESQKYEGRTIRY